MADWQPIETAPRDGTWILAYTQCDSPHDLCLWINKAQWITDRFRPEGGRWWGDAGGPQGWIGEPTHWQPLPDPPK